VPVISQGKWRAEPFLLALLRKEKKLCLRCAKPERYLGISLPHLGKVRKKMANI